MRALLNWSSELMPQCCPQGLNATAWSKAREANYWGVGRGGGEVAHKNDEMGRSKTSHSLTGLYLFLCF